MNYLGGFDLSYNKKIEKAAKVFFWAVTLLVLAIVALFIITLIVSNILYAQISKEEEMIQDYTLDSMRESIEEYDRSIEKISIGVYPNEFFTPITGSIPMSDADIKVSIQCTDLPERENKILYISLSKEIIESYLRTDASLYHMDNIREIKIICGTTEQLQGNDFKDLLCISFFNTTIDTDDNKISKTDYNEHCVMYTQNELSVSELRHFSYCRQIEIMNITDIDSGGASFSDFKDLNYLHIEMLREADEKTISEIKKKLPDQCMLIYP